MNNKLIKLIMSIILFLSIGLGVSGIAFADSTPLSVKAILPENQFDKSVSYYNLMMKAGATQEIELQLFNSSEVETVAEVTLTAATTNDNGLIDYNLPDKDIDASLLYPFNKIASTPKEVTIPAKSDVITKIKIEMPVVEYDGMILGGINVKSKKQESEESEKKSGGMKIENEMSYAIGVVLRENENSVMTDMLLDRVYASAVMGTNTTKATLQNPTSAVMEEVAIEGKVYKKGSDTVLFETKKEGYRMAPNSSFDFGIGLGNKPYVTGDYVMKITATSDPKDSKDGEKQTWNLEKEFHVSAAEAKALNDASAVELEKDYLGYIIIGGISAAVLVAGIITVVMVRNKKKQEALRVAKKRKRKSSKR
ncbi:DUF916 and DUF3324 domain-containing protein [Vagococcus sp. BWB3-3]|uniref:DUF916 and DUF3324 domain-containing protein n=1 Tax=Vagococcus allomyrinae TaxID=2794353 RepID=A0A940P8C9_9ENTE|nr:DUF916 and DUF3324 domain-containing protein [Vagococcus allomyrinae]MBP1039423.1 DUF916 and DUF3324 domain-containing protein [Vagococcus allomyrinae]